MHLFQAFTGLFDFCRILSTICFLYAFLLSSAIVRYILVAYRLRTGYVSVISRCIHQRIPLISRPAGSSKCPPCSNVKRTFILFCQCAANLRVCSSTVCIRTFLVFRSRSPTLSHNRVALGVCASAHSKKPSNHTDPEQLTTPSVCSRQPAVQREEPRHGCTPPEVLPVGANVSPVPVHPAQSHPQISARTPPLRP